MIFHLSDRQKPKSLISQGCEALVKFTLGILNLCGDFALKNSPLPYLQQCCLTEISFIPTLGVALSSWSLVISRHPEIIRNKCVTLGKLLSSLSLISSSVKWLAIIETHGKQLAQCLKHIQQVTSFIAFGNWILINLNIYVWPTL